MSLLSIIIPAYNETKTLPTIVSKVLNIKLPKGFTKEIIIVNDSSTDDTLKIANKLANQHAEIKVLSNETNQGKSQTVRKGMLESTGDWVVIQDADLEYDPDDIVFILENVLKHNCDVGYGNRFALNNGVIYWKNFIGNIGLSSISNLFTIWHNRVFIPDMEVCYKLIRGSIARDIASTIISKSNFGIEPEITAKLSKYRKNQDFLKFIILPIRYYPRSIAEGKKMKAFRDGFKALFEIIYFNIFN
jgi:glycosyltransferase involved in cell wall biosynthesis